MYARVKLTITAKAVHIGMTVRKYEMYSYKFKVINSFVFCCVSVVLATIPSGNLK